MASPTLQILLGVAGLGLFGYATFHVYHEQRPLTPGDLQVVSGFVDRAEEIQSRRSHSLQVWLVNEPVPFRGNRGYPDLYYPSTLSSLRRGASVKIGILPEQRTSPKHDYLRGEDFLGIHTLTVDGTPVFSLDAHNRWVVGNQKIGRWVAPIMVLCSLFLLVNGWRSRVSARYK